MKTIKTTIAIFALATMLLSCSKDDKATSDILGYTLNAESIANGLSTSNKCFINLYDGQLYNKDEAILNSDKVDFAYNYRGDGCNACRFFESVTAMSTRTDYVTNFSTITNSKIVATDITTSEFDNIKSLADINNLLLSKNITPNNPSEDITNRVNDVAIAKVFAFKDKNGKLGFFKIGNYTAMCLETIKQQSNYSLKFLNNFLSIYNTSCAYK